MFNSALPVILNRSQFTPMLFQHILIHPSQSQRLPGTSQCLSSFFLCHLNHSDHPSALSLCTLPVICNTSQSSPLPFQCLSTTPRSHPPQYAQSPPVPPYPSCSRISSPARSSSAPGARPGGRGGRGRGAPPSHAPPGHTPAAVARGQSSAARPSSASSSTWGRGLRVGRGTSGEGTSTCKAPPFSVGVLAAFEALQHSQFIRFPLSISQVLLCSLPAPSSTLPDSSIPSQPLPVPPSSSLLVLPSPSHASHSLPLPPGPPKDSSPSLPVPPALTSSSLSTALATSPATPCRRSCSGPAPAPAGPSAARLGNSWGGGHRVRGAFTWP